MKAHSPLQQRRPKPISSSLAYLKFTLRYEGELRSFWFQQVISEYGLRWLKEHKPEIPDGIATFPGDGAFPFQGINHKPEQIIAFAPKQSETIFHSAALRLVTVFENFLYDCIQRAVFIEPQVMEKSEIKVEAQSIAGAVGTQSVRAWFAHYIADRLCRGKTPKELIVRVDGMLQSGIASRLSTEIDEWCRWTLVRNSIAHLGGDVTEERSSQWNDRFPTPGSRISLSQIDINRLAYISRKLARQLDLGQRPMATRIHDRDLLAHELFVRYGIDDPAQMSVRVGAVLSIRLPRNQSQQLLARFRKNLMVDTGVVLTEEMLSGKLS